MSRRFVGIDVGAETIKLVELVGSAEKLRWTRRQIVEHHKQPTRVLRELLEAWQWSGVKAAAVVGRASRMARLTRVPTKQAQAAGFRQLCGDRPATIVSIGSHGFSVLELRESGTEVYRENARCSQGTGNFLRQLVERFDLSIEQASELSAKVVDPAPLSGRCPVILKTDMTHLANKGERRERILAGLYDAVCENVQVLIKPRTSPPDVLLSGGVSRSARVRDHFDAFLARNNMRRLDLATETKTGADDDALFLDALGAARIAAQQPAPMVTLDELIGPVEPAKLDRLQALSSYLPNVRRLSSPTPSLPEDDGPRELLLGFDIGSTGSKIVALDRATATPVWEGYGSTNGDPVGAAQRLLKQFVASPVADQPVVAFGATGSGREIVGSLLATCFGSERVYVLNEIAAHAEGALHFEPSVDTIFEIGGQDAKYIRLSQGRVVDAAMNEACSAGTGSFIEEQGGKFEGVEDVVQLGQQALCAETGVSLGQHCSVFMAEIIDEAVAAGIDNQSVIAGIYGSVIQNYLNRVKGSRSVGSVVFCQGMPFASDALAAAVARETGAEVIVPPNPGTVGALGIALLTRKALFAAPTDTPLEPLDPGRFLEAQVACKDTFVCKSKQGCGGAGNHCRIDRIATLVASKRKRFTWGGSCSLWDKATGKHKLPDRAPDPFREREALVTELMKELSVARDRKTIALTDVFQLKELLPFFATFLYELGFDLRFHQSEGQKTLKRGIEEANIPFCAPFQHYHGLLSSMAELRPDFLFLPMVRDMPRCGDEEYAVACPIVQGSGDIMRWDLSTKGRPRLLTPVIDFGSDNFDSQAFLQSCHDLAGSLGVSGIVWWQAFQRAQRAQQQFRARCQAIGQEALDYCREQQLIAVVTLGRPYTLYNPELNSHVPPLLREQGAMAIPIDCYPVAEELAIVDGLYWGHGQRNMRAAHQIRRSEGVYSIWCSNYSCGPDSFNLHFYAYAMEGKPFAVIETDGHSGDAGTKTRVEAFLHCVREDLRSGEERRGGEESPACQNLDQVTRQPHSLSNIRKRGEMVLIPRMGPGAEALASCLRGGGVAAEALPLPDREALHLGRRYTSGKECSPMWITLGSLLQRVQRERDPLQRFTFFMPTANGPCRFGVYNILHRMVLARLGHAEKVSIWSPPDDDYFEGLPAGFAALVQIGFSAADWLQEALYYCRPIERRPGEVEAIYERFSGKLYCRLEAAASGDLSLPNAMLQVANGRLFGCTALLREAAAAFRAASIDRPMPTALVVGEIYVRCDPFANDFIIERLEARGIRARFAPFSEWLEYTDHLSRSRGPVGFSAQLSSLVQRRIQNLCYAAVGDTLAWPKRTTVKESIHAARPYVREDLEGEALLTLGGPVHEWREGLIDGVVSVGPHECMPNKVAEAQFFHVAEQEGLLSVTIPVNGDPTDPEIVDSFAFELRSRFEARQSAATTRRSRKPKRALAPR